MRHRLTVWLALALLMFGLALTGALSIKTSLAEQSAAEMTFSLGISDNSGESKTGQALLTLRFETGTPSATTIVAKRGTPTIDGQDGDAAWGPASTVSLSLPVVAGGGPAEATLNAAYDSENIYFLVQWEDPTGTENVHKRMWTYDAASGTWSKSGDEDRVYFLWNINAPDFEGNGCLVYCHVPGDEWTAETLMGTNHEGARVDVWHWKATRTNPMNHAEDKYWVDLTDAEELVYDTETELRTRIADLGGGFDSTNEEEGLPKYMHPDDPGASADFLFEGNVVPFDSMAAWQDGDTVAGYILKEGTGSRADVETVGVYLDGTWTLEFKRALHTGNPDDVSFMPLYAAALGEVTVTATVVSTQSTTVGTTVATTVGTPVTTTVISTTSTTVEVPSIPYTVVALVIGLVIGLAAAFLRKR